MSLARDTTGARPPSGPSRPPAMTAANAAATPTANAAATPTANAAVTPAALPWHDQTTRLGVQVHAHFFDPAQVDARADFVARCLPVFSRARPRRLGDGEARIAYSAGGVCALPDAVFEHGNGLLSLTHLSTARWMVEREHWRGQVRTDAMLQSIAGAMAVAGDRQRPTAALLRLGNALLLFSPASTVIECLASHVGAARRYWNTPDAVTASQLAAFCEPLLRTFPTASDSPDASLPHGSTAR